MGHPSTESSISVKQDAAILQTISRGIQPIPVSSKAKRPRVAGWQKLRWENTESGRADALEQFANWRENLDHGNVGVLTGEPSGGLIDVDLDHPITRRLQDQLLPPTPAKSGTDSRPSSHFWYIAEPGTLQETRSYKMPTGTGGASESIVEYRSTGGQTVIPPSRHPSGDMYRWSGKPWGGKEGPARVDGRVLAVQVALLGFCTLLVKHWPHEGGRHAAYLALAGGLLRVGDGVHPYWERNARTVIEAIAHATGDEDGGEERVAETLKSTITRLREGKKVQGFGKLAEIVGSEIVDRARAILADIEQFAGLPPRTSGSYSLDSVNAALQRRDGLRAAQGAQGPATHSERRLRAGEGEVSEGALEESEDYEILDPLESREGSWEALDLEPYLTGQVEPVMPTQLEREDGQPLLYPGRLNMLYGPSEAAKSWLAMFTCIQILKKGERVVYLDFEDEPVNAIQRMRLLGASDDDLRMKFKYVRPEEALAPMQRSRWGENRATDRGKFNNELLNSMLERHDPSIIVADGMTVLYGLHGLDSNDSVQTDIITSWLKSLTRNGRSTVVVVDHTAKNPERGALPIGSQHKVAMVQGSLLQTYPVKQPMPGEIGEVDLIVLKDRPGQVRAASAKSGRKAQLAAKFWMDSTEEGVVKARLTAPPVRTSTSADSGDKDSSDTDQTLDLTDSPEAEKSTRRTKIREALLSAFGGDLEAVLTLREIKTRMHDRRFNPSRENLNKTDHAYRSQLKILVQQGWLADGPPRGSSSTWSLTHVVLDD